ncbi:RNA-directed DNA polymerase, eukaryota, reverse transcriptase zinc-binding domain protein [Tanacetum coccineum]
MYYWTSLLRRSPRGGIEANQFSSLQKLIKDVKLSDHRDTWTWIPDIAKGFSVASVRQLIDSCLSVGNPQATRWIQAIPIKVNVFLWRLFLNKLPSRVNLDKKCIDLDSLLCPVCNEDVEMVNHLFFSCDMAKDLWSLLARWWGLDIPVCSTILDWYAWLDELVISSKARVFLEGVGAVDKAIMCSIIAFQLPKHPCIINPYLVIDLPLTLIDLLMVQHRYAVSSLMDTAYWSSE